ncbi:MAG TPA: hypothetical protein VGL22_15220 [Terracidiphilus sp.]|jgi:hypothetical protein
MRAHLLLKTASTWPFLLAALCGAQTPSISIALVPSVVQGGTSGATPPHAFVIENMGDSNKTAALTFDLTAVPKGAAVSAVLRVITVDHPAATQQVRVFPGQSSGPSIAQFTVNKNSPSAAESTGDDLSAAVQTAAGTNLVLSLRTSSVRSSQPYYANDADPENRPRLIVSWPDASSPETRNGPELRYRGNPTDATPWRYSQPNGVVVSTLLSGLNFAHISAGPAFHGDDILMIANTQGADSMLYGIAWDGSKRWSYAYSQLGDKSAAWKYLIPDSDRNRVVAFASKLVLRQFDWNSTNGAPATTDAKQIAEVALSKRPAVSAGGGIALLNDDGYVYSFSPLPRLDGLWRSTSVGKVPPVVLSPRGGENLLYFFGNANGSKGFYAADPVRGVLRFPVKGVPAFPDGSSLGNFPAFNIPLAVPVNFRDWVFLSSSENQNGVLEGYGSFASGTPSGWRTPKTGAIARCIAPPSADNPQQTIYCIQNNELRGFIPDGTSVCTGQAPNGVEASNLIADGAGNLYYVAAGIFYGFDRQCKSLFAAPVNLPIHTDGGNDFILSVGPNGVMYARSVQQLFAIQPTQSSWPANTEAKTRYVAQGDMQAPTGAIPTTGPVAFAAVGGQLTFGAITIPSGADVSCSASKGITFTPGFTVEQGATLRCGYEQPPQ